MQVKIDHQEVSQLEEEKRRAEADKHAAISALEAWSIDFMREKEGRKRLEEKIKQLTSSMLIGGQHIEEHPQFIEALE